MWTNGSSSSSGTPAKARRTGNPSPSKPLGAVSASALLAACGGGDDTAGKSSGTSRAGARSTSTTTIATPPGGGVQVESIVVSGRQAVFAAVAKPKGAVLLVHEIFGLTDH